MRSEINPEGRYRAYGESERLMLYQGPEALHDGPAGTGKTTALLWKAHGCARKYANSRILLSRKVRASMNESVLATFENKVLTTNERLDFGPARPAHRTEYVYSNGSVIVPAGLDDPRRIMSTEWDRVFGFEWTETTEEDHEMVLTRIRENHTPYNQFCADCNPSASQHWLIKRAETAKKMARFPSRHTDNPYLFDQETRTWTAKGVTFLATLESLTGNRKRRLLDGIWCADEAAVFDQDVLDRMLEQCRPPRYCLRIGHKLDGTERDLSIAQGIVSDIVVKRTDLPTTAIDAQNRLLWWGELDHDVHSGTLRPPQDRVYVLAADISGGNGASNSVIGIVDRNTREKVGEWVSASISPAGLARVQAILGLWCGGLRKQGHLIWEANYPGPFYGRQLAAVLKYPSLFRRETEESVQESFTTKSDKIGWWNSRPNLRDGIEGLRDAYAEGTYHNYSEASIQEAMQWLRYPGGGMGPGHLQEESTDAKATHGDRVIVDLQLVLGMAIDLPAPKKREAPTHWAAKLIEEPDEDDPGGEIRY